MKFILILFAVGFGASFFILFFLIVNWWNKNGVGPPWNLCPVSNRLVPFDFDSNRLSPCKEKKKSKEGKEKSRCCEAFQLYKSKGTFVYWPNWTLLNPTITSNTSRPWRSCGGSFSASCKLDPLCHGCIVSIALYCIDTVLYCHFVTVVFILSEGLWSDAQIPARCSSNNRGCINV